ncbi:hypothetical protein OG948_19215 [Embleya sp. NBC_00888]|uniref:hypothetical protein n=1 Tax=Embleya sp. NBC_00888 TaxID=2975960 RepID=UPI00386A3181|nr:hypothetical protein OG948_19215 [Embleya sp. NBC_00888]
MRIGRWFIYRVHREVRVERGADPNCRECDGLGGWFVAHDVYPEPDLDVCPCNDGPRIRIPLGRRTRTAYSTEPPF